MEWEDLRLSAGSPVDLALEGQPAAPGKQAVEAHTPETERKIVAGIVGANERRLVTVDVSAVDPERTLRSDLCSIPPREGEPFLGSTRDPHYPPRGVLRVPPDDVDHAVDGVRAPQRGPGAQDDLDALDLAERHILDVPEHPGEERRVDRPAVDQHQQLVGRLVVESAGSDRPLPGADTCHLQPWGKTKRFGQAGGSRAANVVLGDDEDGGGRLGNRLGLAAGGSDLDPGELVEIETGEAAGGGLLSGSPRGAQRGEEHNRDCARGVNSQASAYESR